MIFYFDFYFLHLRKFKLKLVIMDTVKLTTEEVQKLAAFLPKGFRKLIAEKCNVDYQYVGRVANGKRIDTIVLNALIDLAEAEKRNLKAVKLRLNDL